MCYSIKKFVSQMNKKNVLVISILSVLLIIIFTGLPVKKVLSISNRKNQSERYFTKDGYKNGFIISYTHSVNKGRVHDYYKCQNDDTIILDHTVFVSYGAGIPEPEETPGAEFTVTNQGYTISNLQRVVPRLVMAVGIIANHSIAFDYENDFAADKTKEIFLTDLFAPQTSIILEIERVTLINYIFHKIN